MSADPPERRQANEAFPFHRENDGDFFPTRVASRQEKQAKPFLLKLPAPDAPDRSPARAPSRCDFPDTENRRPTGRILLVSADGNLRSLLRSFLEHAGFDVVSCAGASRGAYAYPTGQEPDLLLVDLHSLGEPALELALALKQRCAGLTVVALHDGNSAAKLRRPARQFGWRLVSKPFLVPQLLGVICSALDSDRNRVPARVAAAGSPKSAA